MEDFWTGFPMAENRHIPWIEAERPVFVMQPHCPFSAPPGLDLLLGKSSGDVAPAGFCLQSDQLQTAAPSSANDMLDAASSSASRSDWWEYPSAGGSAPADEFEGGRAFMASPEAGSESIDSELEVLNIPSVKHLQVQLKQWEVQRKWQ